MAYFAVRISKSSICPIYKNRWQTCKAAFLHTLSAVKFLSGLQDENKPLVDHYDARQKKLCPLFVRVAGRAVR